VRSADAGVALELAIARAVPISAIMPARRLEQALLGRRTASEIPLEFKRSSHRVNILKLR